MSSISPNPNPNPKEEIEESRKPNWLDLPEDAWFLILSKLNTIEIIEKAQLVCMLFRNICKQPAMFKIIDIHRPRSLLDFGYEFNWMTRLAVDRSAGGLVDITLQNAGDGQTLMYIVDRSMNLKRLVLLYFDCIFVFNCIFDKYLIEAVEKLPMLEELQLIDFNFSDKTVEGVGRACPSLKSFSLNQVGPKHPDFAKYGNDDDAIAIARSMPQLRYLQLIGNYMSDEGLKAILDGCILLESLDLRACFHLSLSGDLSKRCENIKRVRYPNDSIDDYPWKTYHEWNAQLYNNRKAREEAMYDELYAQQLAGYY